MEGWAAMILVMVVMAGIVFWLYGSMIRSIQDERHTEGVRKIWKNFGLSLGFATLFLVSWFGQGVAQWNHFKNEQRAHNQPAEVREFIADFSASTLENWQSEFLQLFSFVVMAALLIHRGSAESKDSEDRIEAIVKRIEKKLDSQQNGSRRRSSAKARG
jgi:hypothetical protein